MLPRPVPLLLKLTYRSRRPASIHMWPRVFTARCRVFFSFSPHVSQTQAVRGPWPGSPAFRCHSLALELANVSSQWTVPGGQWGVEAERPLQPPTAPYFYSLNPGALLNILAPNTFRVYSSFNVWSTIYSHFKLKLYRLQQPVLITQTYNEVYVPAFPRLFEVESHIQSVHRVEYFSSVWSLKLKFWKLF